MLGRDEGKLSPRTGVSRSRNLSPGSRLGPTVTSIAAAITVVTSIVPIVTVAVSTATVVAVTISTVTIIAVATSIATTTRRQGSQGFGGLRGKWKLAVNTQNLPHAHESLLGEGLTASARVEDVHDGEAHVRNVDGLFGVEVVGHGAASDGPSLQLCGYGQFIFPWAGFRVTILPHHGGNNARSHVGIGILTGA